MLANPFSLKTRKSLENGSGVTPLFSMRTESLWSSQKCRSVHVDAWCKWSLTVGRYYSGELFLSDDGSGNVQRFVIPEEVTDPFSFRGVTSHNTSQEVSTEVYSDVLNIH